MAENVNDTRVPTVVADSVDIIYRVHGTGAGRGSATAALNRMVRRKQAEKAAGTRLVHAVKNVSFVAYKGEAIGLICTNGSGKSTLLKAVAGLLPVEHGAIYTDGQPSLLGVNAALMLYRMTGRRLDRGVPQGEASWGDEVGPRLGVGLEQGRELGVAGEGGERRCRECGGVLHRRTEEGGNGAILRRASPGFSAASAPSSAPRGSRSAAK